MAAPAGTLTYYTYVTLNAPGNSNGDAATIVTAFNNVVFPIVSNTACTASNSSAAVTIIWAQSGERVGDALARDFVANECAALKASLNASVTDIQATTRITLS